MWLDLAMLVGGLLLLYFGAEWLVAGAAGLARSLGISALLVGLTVVAYGTSAPEVVVGVQAAMAGHSDIALGNVIGSNIANIGLILGLTGLLTPPRVDGGLVRREIPVLVLSALAVPLILLDGSVAIWESALLLVAAVIYTLLMVRGANAQVAQARAAAESTAEAADIAGGPSTRGTHARLAGLAVIGLLVLIVGGQIFIEGAVGVARVLGMSERLVGLTIVAIGTSLPELATSLIAAVRGHGDIAVGNVVGSNIFNVLLCLGGAGLAGTVGAPLSSLALDVGVMLALTVLAAIFMRTERTLHRAEAAILLIVYAGFLVVLITG